MDPEQFCTPQKAAPFRKGSPGLRFFGATGNTTQPNSAGTPNTPKSMRRKSNTFHLFPFKNTPTTPLRFPKVINPFESTLAERLHLPLICSPSLFQHPTNSTQNNSGQFEWTIEEVSSLGPANVVAHETQFEATTDPDLEARAQAAISSFFQEHPIVPSPIDCPLRNQKIILPPDISNEDSSIIPGRRIRDGTAQTLLSFPVNLPPEIEKVLKKYFTYNENQQQTPTRHIDCDNSVSFEEEGQQPAADTSHRRKLFQTNDDNANVKMGRCDSIEDIEVKSLEKINRSLSPPPLSPDLANNIISTNSESSLSNTSFGQLSPISKGDTPCKSLKLHEEESRECRSEERKLSHTLTADGSSSLLRTSSSNSLYRSTPDIFLDEKSNSVVQMSIDSSFNGQVQRLNMNSPRIHKSKQDLENSVHKSFSEGDMLNPIFNNKDEECEMQISQFSTKSPNTSGSHSSNSHNTNTPVRKRRSARRKNLSRSFCLEPSDDEDDLNEINTSNISLRKNLFNVILNNDEKRNNLLLNMPSVVLNETLITTEVGKNHQDLTSANVIGQKSLLHKTDSGFTEMTSSQEEFSKFLSHMPDTMTVSFKEELISSQSTDISMNDGDVSMVVCCSTPSCKSS